MSKRVILFLIASVILSCATAGEAPNPAVIDAELTKSVPTERREALNVVNREFSRNFLFYAASLAVTKETPENADEVIKAWILPSESNRVSSWPREMVYSLAKQRKTSIEADANFKLCVDAGAALKVARESTAKEIPAEAGLDLYMLEFELSYTSYVKSKALKKDQEKPPASADPEKKPDLGVKELPPQDVTGLNEIFRILHRTEGVFPQKRQDAAARVGELMTKLSEKAVDAFYPTIYYEIGMMYWAGWGKETARDPKTLEAAKKYFGLCVQAYKGRVSVTWLSHSLTLVNVSADNPEPFIAFISKITELQTNPKGVGVFGFYPYETASKSQMVTKTDEQKELIMKSVLSNMKTFLDQTTDNGTLKRYNANPESLKLIAEALPNTEYSKTAAATLATMKAK